MLKPEENERLTRVGPGTPMGERFAPLLAAGGALARSSPRTTARRCACACSARIWSPFATATGPSAWSGRAARTAARRCSSAATRSAGCAASTTAGNSTAHGDCVDMPSEPPDSLFKNEGDDRGLSDVRGRRRDLGVPGPAPHAQPPPPDYEWLRAPATHRYVSKTFEHCNWLQALEGGLDTAHSSFVHNERLGDRGTGSATATALRASTSSRPTTATPTSRRATWPTIGNYVRVYHYVMPAQQMRGANITGLGGGRAKVPKFDGHIWVPIDDETTYVYNCHVDATTRRPITPGVRRGSGRRASAAGKDDLLPGTTSSSATRRTTT